METFKKIIFSCFLLSLTLGTFAQAATNIPYLDENGNLQIKEAALVTVLTGDETELTDGWYLASGTHSYSATISINGSVYLILEDGCDIFVEGSYEKAGINVTGTNNLTIYAQTTDKSLMGNLMTVGGGSLLTNEGIGGAGISCNSGGNITINGGNIRARGYSEGAGIGGGWNESSRPDGNITINGGYIESWGYTGPSGNKSAIEGGSNGIVIINEGNIRAVAYTAAGISGGDIVINGGTVSAQSVIGIEPERGGAGIGGGGGIDNAESGGNITITGGTVTATGDGAGIGGGNASNGKGGSGGNIVITGGTINATGNGAGIGGGHGYTGGGSGGNITISGGNITASGVSYSNIASSAGIGGGGGYLAGPLQPSRYYKIAHAEQAAIYLYMAKIQKLPQPAAGEDHRHRTSEQVEDLFSAKR